MKPKEEEYVHFVTSIDCLNSAWRTLCAIRDSSASQLSLPAFRFALIEYAKPYKQSIGVLRNEKGKQIRHRLSAEHVPDSHRDLHHRLLSLRDQIHAHCDLTVLEASLYVARTSKGPHAWIVQNAGLGTEEFQRIEEIIQLIEYSLDSMYEEAKRLESNLEPNRR